MSLNPSSQSQSQPQLPRLLLSDVTQKRRIEIRRCETFEKKETCTEFKRLINQGEVQEVMS
ncbi:unnamed protein product [Fusarium graminearum]|uniref:Chromosome 1, complete genome n=1 Tax=Gibberella zeae (strain ATCC MYA-4620 / CBS 123657 / FGSC 9075 / NRRL 31084 / PH-1) TaxID=229533 RepID=A0A098D8S4_GIBZE|nr:unnamed protein product [Fusarium graminearum]CZS78617.1 unnamed protein product [Fusarium graminearum]